MANKWITHIKKTMRMMKSKGTYKKGLGLKQVIKEAKKSWHHAKKGGRDDDPEIVAEDVPNAADPQPLEGGRKRKHGKTARRGRK
jgi:hypothetical protein